MASIERTNYPRLKQTWSEDELKLLKPNEQEMRFVRQLAETNEGRLTILVFLKCHQYLGYLPALNRIPKQVTLYFNAQLEQPNETTLRSRRRLVRHRYRTAIHEYLGIKPYARGGREVAEEIIRSAARTMSDPADLINAAVEKLIQMNFELPGYSTLDRMTARLRGKVHEEIYLIVTARLGLDDMTRLDALLIVRSTEKRADFNRLKESPGRPTLTEMRRWVAHLDWLDTLLGIDTEKLVANLAHTKRLQFAAEARALELGDMRDMHNNGKRYTLLICLIHQARAHVRDDLATMFLKRMRRINRFARDKLTLLRDKHRDLEERMVTTFSRIVDFASETKTDESLGREVRNLLDDLGGIEVVQEQYQQVSAYFSDNHLPLMWATFRTHRAALLRLVQLLGIESTTEDTSLVGALRFVLQNREARRKYFATDLDLGFASERWRALIEHRYENDRLLDRRNLEVCVLTYVEEALRGGDVFVPGSEAFADYRGQLLPWSECETRLQAYCEGVDLPTNGRDFVEKLKDKLDQMTKRVDEDYINNDDLNIDEHGCAHLKRLRAIPATQEAKDLAKSIRERMPQRHLLDILRDVHHWTDYTRHFGPLSGSDPKLQEKYRLHRYLFTIFGLGCGLGATQTARHSLGKISARVIERLNKQHVTVPALEAALRDIIAKYRNLELPRAWGSGKAAIADGTHVELRENNLLGEQHIRYGAYGGIAYHHISDTYVALFSHFIACGVWEAVHILDGLLKNTSEYQPDTIHADTQGQSEPVFGLAFLLAIKLMPRMRTWNDVAFYRPDRQSTYKYIDALFTKVVDWKLIEAHWKDIMQVVISIQAGKILPSMLLRRLGSYSRQNTLYQAFREVGRVARTLYLLEYISDRPLRRRIDVATTKIESFNAFCDWISFGGESIIFDDPIEQEKRIKYTTLVANAVMLSNAVDLTNVLVQLAKDGVALSQQLLALLNPYGTEHIKRFGHFVLNTEISPPPIASKKIPLA